jgi:NNP family nitrate/nitrite transporter-like MFS transporter
MIKLFDNPRKDLPVDPANQKANEINLIQGKRPYMRAFHFSWLSFHIAFTGWFAIAPLLPYIQKDLGATKNQIVDSQITNVSATILFRILVGPLCDRYGPKRVMAILLMLGAIPVGLSALVTTPMGLIIVRFFIGILGATFVPCQFWTTQMFNNHIVGSANAIAGGWGNLGAGITTILMALVADGFHSAGLSNHVAWRVSLVIPAVLCFGVGLLDWLVTDDCPQGDWSQRAVIKQASEVEVHDANKVAKGDAASVTESEKGASTPSKPGIKPFFMALSNPNVVILVLQYACCFGVELAVDAALTIFFFHRKNFNLTEKNAGLIASLFGLMNVFSRASGGFLSDYANEKMGMRGRLLVQFLVLFFEGLFLFIFNYTVNNLTEAIIILILFSYFTQAGCGTSFGIVPFVDRNMGIVSGWVGGGGSIGGAVFTAIFKLYGFESPTPFMVIGIVVMVVSLTTFFLRVDGKMLIELKRRN